MMMSRKKLKRQLIEYKKSEKYNNYCNDYKEENCKIEYFAGSYHVKDDEQESADASPALRLVQTALKSYNMLRN